MNPGGRSDGVHYPPIKPPKIYWKILWSTALPRTHCEVGHRHPQQMFELSPPVAKQSGHRGVYILGVIIIEIHWAKDLRRKLRQRTVVRTRWAGAGPVPFEDSFLSPLWCHRTRSLTTGLMCRYTVPCQMDFTCGKCKCSLSCLAANIRELLQAQAGGGPGSMFASRKI